MKLNTSKGANVNYLAESVHVDKFSTHPNTSIRDVVDNDRNLVDLSKIWHEVSEEPKKGTHILMEDDFLHSKEYKSYKIGDSLVNNWDTLKKFYRISRWAYITDLLPKGGEK